VLLRVVQERIIRYRVVGLGAGSADDVFQQSPTITLTIPLTVPRTVAAVSRRRSVQVGWG